MPFPTTLDTTSTIPVEASTTPLSTNHVANHTAMQTAIIAIENLIGITASAVTGTFNYILGEITGSDKAVGKTATQTLTNKTLTAPTITSPTINLTSDAEGDTYYRNSGGAFVRLPKGTDNHIYKMNGNVPNWEAEATIVAATESLEGISRIATAAQITAGTATEGGYPLFVAPDQLASSTPVFNGSGLTSTVGSIWKNNVATYDLATASGTVNIAHGCGRTPKAVFFEYFMDSTQGTAWNSSGSGAYDGTTNSTTGMLIQEADGVFQSSYAGNGICIRFEANNTGGKQEAVATLDATNIILTWTKTGTPSGTGYFMWKTVA